MIWFKTGLKYLRECDMFGTPVSLKLDNRSHYKSKLGAIVSIMSIFLITTLCWSSKKTKKVMAKKIELERDKKKR